MDANERESRAAEEHDPIRAYATQNVAQQAAKPRSSAGPFLISVLITAAILGIAFYLWGR
jgi:uncharacterized protein HemX